MLKIRFHWMETGNSIQELSLEPDDPLPQGDRKVTLKNYIGSWLMLEETSGLDFNYGTYRKVVTGIKPTEDYYFFQSKDILRSAKVFINGKELIERGRVVDNRKTSFLVRATFTSHLNFGAIV